jgi:transcriptional regulator with XRE-family HTH domain
MSQDWARLARAIQQARESRVMPGGARMTQQQLADEAGVSLGTIQNLEDPKRTRTRRPPTLALVEQVFWKPGSAAAVLDGGDPIPLSEDELEAEPETPPAKTSTKASERLPLRVQHELRGDVVDTDVIDLGRGGMKMVVVITREPGQELPDDDQLREDFREWSRVQRALRGIVAPGTDTDPSVV